MDTDTAIKAWCDLLGTENTLIQSENLQTAQTATFATQQQILAILRPENIEQIQACLKIANEYCVPVYPISGGKNWGYGSRVPVKDNCALLDLSKLNRIVDYNEKLAYVTVEPGVTQRRLYEFLQKQQSRLWMDSTGSSHDSSIIGNAIERGFGHTPYGDRFAHICGLEVVLPTGEIIHTGLGQFSNAKAAPVYRWGVGAFLDGLFSQSNFGIVTKMTFWLMPAPEYFQSFSFTIKEDQQLPDLIDALQPLRLNGTIKSAVHVGNSYKVLSAIRQYPWAEAEGVTPLPESVKEQFIKAWKLSAWSGSGGLYGTKQQVAEARRLIKQALKGKVEKLQFLDDQTLQIAKAVAKPYQRLTGLNLPEMLKLLRPVYRLMQGIPSESQLASTYWRKKTPPPREMNPDRDGCGLIWCAPVAPLEGEHAAKINQIVQEILPSYGFEPIISMTLLTERCLSTIITIAYDREVPGEDEQAMNCYNTLLEKLTEEGYYPYRLGIQSMDLLQKGEESYQKLLKQLKKSIDPNQVLAPGRYGSF